MQRPPLLEAPLERGPVQELEDLRRDQDGLQLLVQEEEPSPRKPEQKRLSCQRPLELPGKPSQLPQERRELWCPKPRLTPKVLLEFHQLEAQEVYL